MSDNLSVKEQTAPIERARREHENLRYFLFTSVSTEGNKSNSTSMFMVSIKKALFRHVLN